LLSGVSVVGVDRDQLMVRRAKENLTWLRHKYNITKELRDTVFAFDARRISKARMQKVDAIATEPILLPVFESNPGVLDARKHIEKAREMYERCVHEFANVLSRKNQRVAIVSPVLIDSSGSPRTFDISEVARSAGLMPFTSSTVLSNLIAYPIRLESMKKRTIQRNLYVFYLK
jgi:tRNA G10  N-methylase Trm11